MSDFYPTLPSGDLLLCAKRLFVEDNREEHVFHQHVLHDKEGLKEKSVTAITLWSNRKSYSVQLPSATALA